MSEKQLGTNILRTCTCTHAYQDKKYKGKRVHTIGKKYDTCTVCGNKKAN